MKKIIIAFILFSLFGTALFAEETLFSGELGEKRRSPLSGTWEIVEREEGERVLKLNEDFRARRGPDLKIFFSKLPLNRISDYNADSKSYAIKIGNLKAFKGEQEYILPATLDLEEYTTWVVHCERYSHLWDGAELIADAEDEDADAEDEDADAEESEEDDKG